jgi:hypothetical protein
MGTKLRTNYDVTEIRKATGKEVGITGVLKACLKLEFYIFYNRDNNFVSCEVCYKVNLCLMCFIQ